MAIRVFIAEPQALRRSGLLSCLAGASDLKCVGQVGAHDQLRTAIRTAKADVIILSDELIQQDHGGLIEALRAVEPTPAILVLLSETDTAAAKQYLQSGVAGLLADDEADPETLIKAVRRVAAGEVSLSSAFITEVLSPPHRGKGTRGHPVDLLTPREMTVFRLTGEGLESKEIASRLSLSPRTVDVHRANIRNKLHLRGAHELMRYAMEWLQNRRQAELLGQFAQESRPVLLVEDDEVDILSVQRAFEQLGAAKALAVARSGDEALAYLRSGNKPMPTLILLDLKLPRMSGWEMLTEMRHDAGLSTIPVVVLTSSRQEEDIVRMYRFGLAGYLVKPSTSAEFMDMFRTLAQYWAINVRPPAPVATPPSSGHGHARSRRDHSSRESA